MVLFGGPAGAGKSTLARAWCQTRQLAAHIELDEITSLIVSGLVDPQESGDCQEEQYRLTVEATCMLARTFAGGGCDVAIDDVLARSAKREKRVKAAHTRTQHRHCAEWPVELQIDTTGLRTLESLVIVHEHLASRTRRSPDIIQEPVPSLMVKL